ELQQFLAEQFSLICTKRFKASGNRRRHDRAVTVIELEAIERQRSLKNPSACPSKPITTGGEEFDVLFAGAWPLAKVQEQETQLICRVCISRPSFKDGCHAGDVSYAS